MLKFSMIVVASLGISACDSGTSTAAPAAKPAAVAQDWTKTVVGTPEGGFRMGNPDAKVKIVEFASFTCSHCKDFYTASMPTLKGELISKGQVSLEYRPFVLNFWDVIAATVAKCEGPERFFNWADQLYTNQEGWLAGIQGVTEQQVAQLQSLPEDKQLLGVADAAKISDFARTRGMPRAKFEACLTNPAAAETLTTQRDVAARDFNVQGTPTFVMNGKVVEGVNSWAQLEPKIRAAL